jgi:hypothetical protein
VQLYGTMFACCVCRWLQIICSKLPHIQLIHFLDSLLDGLLDAEPCSSSGASVVLNVLLKSKGGELYHQVNDILCKKILIGWNINVVVYIIVHMFVLSYDRAFCIVGEQWKLNYSQMPVNICDLSLSSILF